MSAGKCTSRQNPEEDAGYSPASLFAFYARERLSQNLERGWQSPAPVSLLSLFLQPRLYWSV